MAVYQIFVLVVDVRKVEVLWVMGIVFVGTLDYDFVLFGLILQKVLNRPGRIEPRVLKRHTKPVFGLIHLVIIRRFGCSKGQSESEPYAAQHNSIVSILHLRPGGIVE